MKNNILYYYSITHILGMKPCKTFFISYDVQTFFIFFQHSTFKHSSFKHSSYAINDDFTGAPCEVLLPGPSKLFGGPAHIDRYRVNVTWTDYISICPRAQSFNAIVSCNKRQSINFAKWLSSKIISQACSLLMESKKKISAFISIFLITIASN